MEKDRTYVITASVYVDGVADPREATEAVESFNENENEGFNPVKIEIRLPDRHEGNSRWEQSGN